MRLLIPFLFITQPPLSFPPPPGTHPLRYGDKVKESIITEIMDKRYCYPNSMAPRSKERSLKNSEEIDNSTIPYSPLLTLQESLLTLPLTMIVDKEGKISLIEYPDKKEEEIKEEILNHIRGTK